MPPTLARRRDRQVVRLLTILRLLCNGSAPSVHALASRFHVRRESIYRDLKALQEIGFPIVGDALGRLSRPRLASEARLAVPPVFLTKRELIALTWAAKQGRVICVINSWIPMIWRNDSRANGSGGSGGRLENSSETTKTSGSRGTRLGSRRPATGPPCELRRLGLST